MGDRGNIVVVQHADGQKPTGELFLYTHWGGAALPLFVQATLQRRQRWDDEIYLARMLFCALIQEPDELKEETGLGLSCYLGDNEYPLLKVDCRQQTVTLADTEAPTQQSWTFEEFVALSLDEEDPWSSLGWDPSGDE